MDFTSTLRNSGAAVLLLALVAACSSNDDDSSTQAPSVLSNAPVDLANGVPVNASVAAQFSEEMDSATLNTTTFTVTSGPAATPVPGTVVYDNSRVVFWPSVHLADNVLYTATITTGAQDASGVGLVANHGWTFTTGTTTEPGLPVDLGTAGNFAILSKAGISTVPGSSAVIGDMGVSPMTATGITEFALTMDASGVFATSPQVTGNVYAADYTPPTPNNLTTAVSDMETAFEDAAARAPDVTELSAGLIGTAVTLAPGVYKWGTGLQITANVNLAGSATDVWVFQIAQDLTVASGIEIGVTAGAVPENVFWQVTGLVDLDTTSNVDGILLCATAIALKTNATVNGRLLAQTAVSLDHSTVTEPAQ